MWKYLEALSFDTTQYHPLSDQIHGADTIAEERARRVRLEFARLLEQDVRLLSTKFPDD